MTAIIYKPHCGNCGVEISERPIIQKWVSVTKYGQHKSYDFTPQRCPKCNAYFQSAVFKPPIELEEKVIDFDK